MITELCIGIFVTLFIWITNFYNLVKYPDKYKIIKVNL